MRIRLAARLARLPRRTGRPGTGIGMSGRSAALDTSVAHPARRYDYWLGGKDNFAADRQSGDQIAAAFPDIVIAVQENRRFLRRVVTYLAEECGIRQFLDIGTGLPTADNTHEIAQRIATPARVVYVDNDPLVLDTFRGQDLG
jgi:S-adenosyl methyltransferase